MANTVDSDQPASSEDFAIARHLQVKKVSSESTCHLNIKSTHAPLRSSYGVVEVPRGPEFDHQALQSVE